MMSWRMDLAVLTDLSASMFAATFMILLIFLSLVQQKDARPTPAARQAIEATTALRIVRRPVLAPADMVGLLHRHGSAAGLGIDVFEDRLEVFLPGAGGPVLLDPTAIPIGLSRALGSIGDSTVRLYVFSNALYNQALPVLEKAGAKALEVTVPRALRDPARPAGAWSEAFLRLGARRLEQGAFREGLAALLEGRASKSSANPSSFGHASKAANPFVDTHPWLSLLECLRRWLQTATALILPALGFLSILLIERRRRIRMGR